jgi:phage terminase small subunit
LSAEGKRAFRQLVIDIDAAWPGTLARMDVMGLSAAAEAYAVIVRAAKTMRDTELVEDDPAHKGRVRKTPAWELFAQASRLFTAWAREYGLTLSSRLRLELDAGAPLADEDEEDLDAVL